MIVRTHVHARANIPDRVRRGSEMKKMEEKTERVSGCVGAR